MNKYSKSLLLYILTKFVIIEAKVALFILEGKTLFLGAYIIFPFLTQIFSFSIFAGLPAAIQLLGIFFVTTLPPPITT